MQSFEAYNPSYVHTRRFGQNAPIWAMWHYEPDEWSLFTQQEAEQSKRTIRKTLLIFPLVAVPIGTIFGIIDYTRHSAQLNFGLIVAALIIFVGLLLCISPLEQLLRMQRSGRIGPREVYITPISIRIADTNIKLIGVSTQLLWVSIAPKNSHILRFSVHNHGTYEVRVPIPVGREAEAEELIQKFRDEVFNPKRKSSR